MSILCRFYPMGQCSLQGHGDGTVRLWDVNTRTNTTTLRHQYGNVYSVAFSPDGKTLASASVREVKLWDVETKIDIATLAHTSRVYSVVYSPDGTSLATGVRDGTINLWDVETQSIATLRHTRGVYFCCRIHQMAQCLLQGICMVARVRLWDVSNRRNYRCP